MENWGPLLVGQLDFYWTVHLRPRLSGLTDEEYFWEPVADCWSLRERDGQWVLDEADPVPEPAPVTTIAWRIIHLAAYNLAARTSTFFGDGSVPGDAPMHDPRHVPADLPGTAAEAIAFFERHYQDWHRAVAELDDETLSRPLGPRGGFYRKDSMAALIVHVNRETIHHGGEIGVLRDLYRRRYR
jgi:hypothetical protein